jgi:hypothetical protein
VSVFLKLALKHHPDKTGRIVWTSLLNTVPAFETIQATNSISNASIMMMIMTTRRMTWQMQKM